MFSIIWQYISLLAFWLLVSGSYDWQHLVMGSGVALLLTLFWRGRTERLMNSLSLRRLWLSLLAIVQLLREIWLAAWQVVPLVLSRELAIEPTLVRTRSSLRSDRLRTFYANSITLTPGTLTVQLEQNRLLVHALTKEAAEGVVAWSFEHNLKRLEDAK